MAIGIATTHFTKFQDIVGLVHSSLSISCACSGRDDAKPSASEQQLAAENEQLRAQLAALQAAEMARKEALQQEANAREDKLRQQIKEYERQIEEMIDELHEVNRRGFLFLSSHTLHVYNIHASST